MLRARRRAAAYALTDGTASRGGRPYELYVHARDYSKALDLAETFGGTAIEDFEGDAFSQIVDDGGFAAVVSTVPGDANFELPQRAMDSLPAVLDAAYKPAETALLRQAIRAGAPLSQGATMLVEQGIAQFQLWTQLDAPADVMRAAVFEGVPNLEESSSALAA